MEQHANPPTADKRLNLRVSLVVQRVTGNTRVRTLFGYADNISRGGLFIATENPREPGSQFELELDLPRPIARRVRVHCQVVWWRRRTAEIAHPPGMGLRFLDLPLDVAQAIERWTQQA